MPHIVYVQPNKEGILEDWKTMGIMTSSLICKYPVDGNGDKNNKGSRRLSSFYSHTRWYNITQMEFK